MEKSYAYPSNIRTLGRILIALAFVVCVILGIAALADHTFSLELLIFAALFAAAFASLGGLLIRSHSVRITLSDQGIAFVRRNKCRVVAYDRIQRVAFSTRVFSAMLLITDCGRFSVSKTLVGYPDFAQQLEQRVPTLQAKAADSLRFRCRTWESYISCGLFLLLSLGFAVLAVVAMITGEMDVGSGVLIVVVLLPFIIALLAACIKAPRRYTFEPDSITVISLMGAKVFKAAAIESVEYGQKKPKTRSRFGSPILHFIELRFLGSKAHVWVDQTDTDFPIDNIADYVKAHYPVEGRFEEVSLNQSGKA